MKKNKYLLILMIATFTAAALLLTACAEPAPEAKSYTVIFQTNGGSEVAPVLVAEGTTLSVPAAPAKPNAAFEGWYKDAALTQAWNFLTDTVTADVTLFAKWVDAAYVIIADAEGSLVLVRQPVGLSDRNSNGSFSIDEVLFSAHESYYPGGAEAGYATSSTQWGLGITKLWGDVSGNYGYYVNNRMAWSLDDEVAAGDCLYAYVISDAVYWSDAYSYFNTNTAEVSAGENISLRLTYIGFDSDWNPTPLPAEGATITINGASSSYATDAQGEVVLTFTEAGNYIISARSDTLVLVPPVCIVKVT